MMMQVQKGIGTCLVIWWFTIIFKSNEMSEEKEMLEYYQGKVDELYRERLAWLTRFDECGTQMEDKHRLMQKLKDQKDKQADLQRGVIYHDVALLDEKINVVKMDRDNINNEYADAEEVLKIEQLAEEYPAELDKRLPCKIWGGNEMINNELNIHSKSKKAPKGNKAHHLRQQNYVLSGKEGKEGKVAYKPTAEELLRRQIIELKTNQEKEVALLQEQGKKLENLIRGARKREEDTLDKERGIVDHLQKELKKQEGRHQKAADKYFNTRKRLKEEHEMSLKQNEKLKETLAILEGKLAKEEEHYDRETKAKQTLVIRKSEDFQEDYKARMRAKERNLQALRDNYEQMQEVCIEKITALEEALNVARRRLQQTKSRREETIQELKHELGILERQDREERIEKARIDMQMKEKLEQDKRRRQELEQREEKARKKLAKGTLIEQAYGTGKRRGGKSKSRSKGKGKGREPWNRPPADNDSESEESLEMSDLENIRKQINRLEDRIEAESKKR